MPRALITGIEGFTGRYMADELRKRSFDVGGTSQQHDSMGDHVYICDLLDEGSLKCVVGEFAPDVVVHLAAISFVEHENVAEIYRANVIGTRNLLSALVETGCQVSSVLLASSANVYGNATVDPISEKAPVSPQNDYAVSKYAMELMARLWLDRLPIVLTRPFNYTGVGQSDRFLLPKIVDHFRRGESTIKLGNTDVSRDFSDVRDVVRQYADIVSAPISSDVFNVCSGVATSLDEVLALMAEIAGYRIDVTIEPAFVRDNEVKRLRGSNAKLVNALAELGDKSHRPLVETLRWMFEAPAAGR